MVHTSCFFSVAPNKEKRNSYLNWLYRAKSQQYLHDGELEDLILK